MAKLSPAELAKREDVIMKMKKNKRGLVKRYGSDAEKVMYGRATNIAKKVTETQMKDLNLKELVRTALMQEKAGFSKEFDSDPALKGGQKNLPDGLQKAIIKKEKGVKEDQRIVLFDPDKSDKIEMGKGDPTIQKIKTAYSRIFDDHRALVNHITKTYPEVIKDQKVVTYFNDINTVLKTLKDIWQSEIKEDLDLGHEDDEPHMIKGELYRIGKYAMELYQMVDQFDGEGEVDFPAWWQAKITTAKNMVSSAKHYLEFELKEPEIDAMVDIAAAEDIIPNIPSVPLEDEIEEGLPKGYFKKATAELDESAEENQLNEISFEEIKSIYVSYKVVTEWGIPLFVFATLLASFGIAVVVQLIRRGKNELIKKYNEIKGNVDKEKVKKAEDLINKIKNKNEPLDESFEKLVGKLKKQGKSEKASKAIAGAVASYKAKGGGKGPTAKQKAR